MALLVTFSVNDVYWVFSLHLERGLRGMMYVNR